MASNFVTAMTLYSTRAGATFILLLCGGCRQRIYLLTGEYELIDLRRTRQDSCVPRPNRGFAASQLPAS